MRRHRAREDNRCRPLFALMVEDGDTPETVGWDAINAALRPIYGGREPQHWGPIIRASLGGPDPLDGISAYLAENPSHWHFVTYGMSELYEKENGDPEFSGWGFEFTFRVRRRGDTDPPAWVLNFLNNLARYVFQTGNVFESGHHLDLNGPIALDEETAIRAIAFTTDPQLGSISTPSGRVTFLQVVGLTLDEYEALQAWNTEKLLQLRSKDDPLLVTDLRRTSWLQDPAFARQVAEGQRRDGSSQSVTFASKVEWEAGASARVALGANAVRQLSMLLAQRLPFGRPFRLAGAKQAVRFEPADFAFWRADEDALVVGLRPEHCTRFCDGLPPRRGTYRWAELPGFEVVVVPSEIKDADGNVIQTIG
jgi:suppressor of fused